MVQCITEDDCKSLGTALLKDFYEAPLPSGQKNSTWLARSQDIRKALEAFWRGLRKSCKRAFEASKFSAEEVSETLEVISGNLAQDYIDSVEAEKRQILDNIKSACP